MDSAISKIQEILLAQGVIGIAVLVLGFVAYRLYKQLSDVQEERLEDARGVTKALENNTAALNSLTKLIESRRERL